MQATLKVAAGVLVALAGVGWWLTSSPDREEPRVLAEAPLNSLSAAVQAPLAGPELANQARRDASLPQMPQAPTASEPASASEAAKGPAVVQARLVDQRGRGVSGTLSALFAEVESTTASDSEGRCRLEFAAIDDENLPRSVIARAPNMATRFVGVKLEAGVTISLGELVLAPGSRASGVVLLPDGRPAVGARVIAAQPSSRRDDAVAARCGPDEQELVPACNCDNEGRFHLEGIPSGRLFLWAGLRDMRWTHTKLLEFAPMESIDDVQLRLVPLAREDHIAGLVLDPAGAPLPGARLRYRVQYNDSTSMGDIPVDSAGRFDYRLEVSAPHDLTASDPRNGFAAATQLQVEPGELNLVLQLGLRRTIVVQVVDAAGVAVTQFGAALSDADGFGSIKRFAEAEHADGRMEIELPASGVSIYIRASGFDTAELGPFDLKTAPETVRAVLVQLPGIQGRVVVGGKPLAGARLSLHRISWPDSSVDYNGFPSRLDPGVQAQGTSDDDGRFFLTARESNDFALLVESAGQALSELEIRGFEKSVGASKLLISMSSGGSIEGAVRVATGRSPEGTLVAINRGDLHPRTQRVGADGHFSFEHLTPGGWTVRSSEHEIGVDGSVAISSREERDAFPVDVHVHEGETTHFDLDLSDERPCVLRGRITIDGRPASEWRAVFWPDTNGVANVTLPSTLLDPEGRFEFSAAEPGYRRVRFAAPSHGGSELELVLRVEVLRGENHVERKLATGRVEGRSPVGTPRLIVEGSCDPELSYSASIQPGADGHYELEGLPCGYLKIQALPLANSGSTEWAELHALDLKPGQHLVLD